MLLPDHLPVSRHRPLCCPREMKIPHHACHRLAQGASFLAISAYFIVVFGKASAKHTFPCVRPTTQPRRKASHKKSRIMIETTLGLGLRKAGHGVPRPRTLRLPRWSGYFSMLAARQGNEACSDASSITATTHFPISSAIIGLHQKPGRSSSLPCKTIPPSLADAT